MLLAVLFGLLVGKAHDGSYSYKECMAQKFEPKACWNSEQLYKAGKYLCKVQGKGFDGSSDCVKKAE